MGRWRPWWHPLCQWSGTGLTEMRISLRIDSEYINIMFQHTNYYFISSYSPSSWYHWLQPLNRHPLRYNSSTNPRRADRTRIHILEQTSLRERLPSRKDEWLLPESEVKQGMDNSVDGRVADSSRAQTEQRMIPSGTGVADGI